MPTLQEWSQALSTPRLVEVESSQAVALKDIWRNILGAIWRRSHGFKAGELD
jgi:hypothetical protein